MLTKEEIMVDLDKSTVSLLENLKAFPEEDFNQKPDVNVWSAGDVFEHIFILESFINKVMMGNTRNAERDSQEKILQVKNVFLNFDRKLNAPDPVAPTLNTKSMNKLLADLENSRGRTKEILLNEDLTLICPDFIHRAFGEFSRAEWIYFCIYHSQRHFFQLENIKERLSEAE